MTPTTRPVAWALAVVPVLLLAACSSPTVTLRLSITADADVGALTALTARVLVGDGDAARVASLEVPFDPARDLVADPYVLQIDVPEASPFAAEAHVAVVGLHNGTALATWLGKHDLRVVDTVEATLGVIDVGCDQDGDGFKHCATAGCCTPNEKALGDDCDDAEARANPFAEQAACRDCRDLGQDGVSDCLQTPAEPTPEPVVEPSPDALDALHEAVDADSSHDVQDADSTDDVPDADLEAADVPGDGDGDSPDPGPDHDAILDAVETEVEPAPETTDADVGDVCAPDCTDKVCGDDGCGGSCGGCPTGKACVLGACVCPDECAYNGKRECTDATHFKTCSDPDSDTCLEWGAVSACDTGNTCAGGQCACTPDCTGKACGDDGCGGSCGGCGGGKVCDGAQCVCLGAIDDDCDGIDDDCNAAADEDYVPVTSCFKPGACAAGNRASSCTDGVETPCETGTPGTEECNGADDDCDGTPDDGGDALCGLGEACQGAAGCVCAPDCAGRVCGDDGCGGSCGGACPDGKTCSAGQCVCPGAKESCGDLTDNDCDGQTDEPGAQGCGSYFKDADADLYGDADTDPLCLCFKGQVPYYTAAVKLDCDDADNDVHPGTTEVCNGVDDDCNTQTDEDGDALCGPGETCQGAAGCACVPDCAGRTCGSNGCGGSCGSCTNGKVCDAGGQCAADTGTAGFVAIAAGGFWMGSPGGEACPAGYAGGGCPGSGTAAAEKGRGSKETLHYVRLSRPIEVDATEATQGDWKATFGGWNAADFDTCGDSCPVERVNWYEALAYANARSQAAGLAPCYALTGVTCEDSEPGASAAACMTSARGGIMLADVVLYGVATPYACKGYRLPTEAEWEYAYRAGSVTALYPSPGNDGTISQISCAPVDSNLDKIAWYCGNDGSITKPVAGKAPNAWGLWDLSGNVWEWAWDLHGTYPQGSVASPATDPTGATSSDSRVIRGGSWYDYASAGRAAYRGSLYPSDRRYYVGLRLVRTLPDTDVDGDPDVTDCAPGDAALHHGAIETCNDIDDDCDDTPDDGGDLLCNLGETCQGAAGCVCAPDCAGRQCGDDGCGGSCGTCGLDQVCNGDGACAWNGTTCGGVTCPALAGYTFACNAQAHCEYTNLDPTGWRQWDTWIYLAPGSFTMGSPPAEAGHLANEEPQHTVTFAKGYFIGKYEVTVGTYEACATESPGTCATLSTAGWDADGWGLNSSTNGRADHPQDGLTFDQAGAACAWLGGRLPSEAEWEGAATGPSHRVYPWGDSPAVDCDHAVFDPDGTTGRPWGCETCTTNGCSGTKPVGTKEAGVSASGCLDMCGNLWEWCQDWWHDSYTGAPVDGSAWTVPTGTLRVRRGGSFHSTASQLRTAARGAVTPSVASANHGARCVRDLPLSCGGLECPFLGGYKAACNPQAHCEYTNLDPTGWKQHDVWIYVAPGSFPMGSPPGEAGHQVNEEPQHTVTFGAGYYIGKYEVTAATYAACQAAAPGTCTAPSTADWDGTGWGTNTTPGRDDHPQNGLTWDQAGSVCAWMGARRPSEAEWEYAAAGPSHHLYPWGDTPAASCAGNVAVYDEDGSGTRPWGCEGCATSGCSGTKSVGSKAAGAAWSGALDMAGNVWEWCEDWYHGDYASAPANGSAWVSPTGSGRVLRGGSFNFGASTLRSAARTYDTPGYRSVNRGVRCVRPLP